MSQPQIIVRYEPTAESTHIGVVYINNRRAFVHTGITEAETYQACVSWWNKHGINTGLLENPEPIEIPSK